MLGRLRASVRGPIHIRQWRRDRRLRSRRSGHAPGRPRAWPRWSRVLSTIETGRESTGGAAARPLRQRASGSPPTSAIALATDSVGSKVIVAEQAQRFDTIGIDCVAMNVNDLICVGAEPLALLDYIAVERADPELLARAGRRAAAGAEDAGVEIPGGEVCQLPEVHPRPPVALRVRPRRLGVRHGRARRDHRRPARAPRRCADRPAGVRRALQRPDAGPARAARRRRAGAGRAPGELGGATRRRRRCSSRP